MRMTYPARLLAAVATCSILGSVSAQAQAPPRADWMAKPPAATAATDAAEPPSSGIRTVVSSPHELITIAAKLHYTAVVILPEDEEIMDVVCGDIGFWQIDTWRGKDSVLTAKNIVYVKPSGAGKETNLNVTTTSGGVYSFVLKESSKWPVPDLKVYVDAGRGDGGIAPKKFVAIEQFEAVQAQLAEARAQLDIAKQRAEEQAEAKRREPAALICDYTSVPNKKPFFVESICHSNTHTYIKTGAVPGREGAKEMPALYARRDGKPAVLEFRVEDGTYIAPVVIDRGYLQLGNEQLSFALKTFAEN
jgi:type IV secretory pathway VirB9-like protein